MTMIAWRDLRSICKECKKRADFSVEYNNDDLPKNYLQGGTRVEGYCLKHLPQEVITDRERMIKQAQEPF